MIRTFSVHAKISDDKVFFVVCVEEDVQQQAFQLLGRELTEVELEAAYKDFNDNLPWRNQLEACIKNAVKEKIT